MSKKIAFYALMIAMTVAVSMLVIIPVPGTNGFVTLVDAGVNASAMVFGPVAGLVIGALSGGLIDLFSGYSQWIIFSLLIHGIQGWVVGYFAEKGEKQQFIGVIIGGNIMVIGYALASWLLYGVGGAIASVPSNMIQATFGIIVAIPLSKLMKRVLPSLPNMTK